MAIDAFLLACIASVDRITRCRNVKALIKLSSTYDLHISTALRGYMQTGAVIVAIVSNASDLKMPLPSGKVQVN